MYDCEICGRKTDTLYIIEVEGAELTSCAKCSEGKDVVDTIGSDEGRAKAKGFSAAKAPVLEEELVDNFGDEIRKARERLGLPLNVLAERINEKESTLNRVEHGKMQPTVALTKKLEKQLGIRLTSMPEQLPKPGRSAGGSSMTLGDAAAMK